MTFWATLPDTLVATLQVTFLSTQQLHEIFANLSPWQDAYKDFLAGGQQALAGFISLVFITPIVETLFHQMLIIWLISLFTKSIKWQLLISSAIFGAAHLTPGNIIDAFYVGIFLGWSYILKKRRSIWQAVTITSIIHSLANLWTIILVSILR